MNYLVKAKRADGIEIQGYLMKARSGVYYIVTEFDNYLNCADHYPIDKATIRQCIGLKDLQNVNIFDGDLLNNEYIVILKRVTGSYIIGCYVVDIYSHELRRIPSELIKDDKIIATVTGNIYDNPNFMKLWRNENNE